MIHIKNILTLVKSCYNQTWSIVLQACSSCWLPLHRIYWSHQANKAAVWEWMEALRPYLDAGMPGQKLHLFALGVTGCFMDTFFRNMPICICALKKRTQFRQITACSRMWGKQKSADTPWQSAEVKKSLVMTLTKFSQKLDLLRVSPSAALSLSHTDRKSVV